MHYIVLFEDDPAAPAGIRSTHMTAHLAFLEANAAAVSAAGPLATPSGTSAGGIWIVEAETADEVTRLVHADPFWPTGLRKSVRILQWTRVYADGSRLIHQM